MRNIDFAPLNRSFIGFDRLATLLDNASQAEKQPSFPPYNIELMGENNYRITMAVAGFAENEIKIMSEQNALTVTGTKQTENKVERTFTYQGIAERNFERKFQLGDHLKVIQASMENGLLHIDLEREIPEEMKPKEIAINGQSLLTDK